MDLGEEIIACTDYKYECKCSLISESTSSDLFISFWDEWSIISFGLERIGQNIGGKIISDEGRKAIVLF